MNVVEINKRSKSSFEIARDARHLAAAIMDLADENGEVDDKAYDEWLREFESTCSDIKTKLQSLRAVRTRLLAEAEMLKAEAARISSHAKRRSSDADRVRGYMKDLLVAHREVNPGNDKVELEDGFVRLNKRTSYEVEMVGEYHRVPESLLLKRKPALNKAAVIKAYREGKLLSEILVTEVVTEHVMEGGG